MKNALIPVPSPAFSFLGKSACRRGLALLIKVIVLGAAAGWTLAAVEATAPGPARLSEPLHGRTPRPLHTVGNSEKTAGKRTVFPVLGGTRPADDGAMDVEYCPDHVLVAFQPGVGVAEAELILDRASPCLKANRPALSPFFEVVWISGDALEQGFTVEEALARLRADPLIRVAEPDYVVHATDTVPNDPDFKKLWGLRNTGQGNVGYDCSTCSTPGADISAVKAWDLATGSAQAVVAVIDTGVDYNHPDLVANILRDGYGHLIGYDYANNDDDPLDDFGHGTHCAGTIGAVGNNGLGVTGVCWTVRIMPMKFLDASGSGLISNAIPCVDYAVAHGAHVLSNSWSGGGYSQLLLEAIKRAEAADVLFVAAAGNNGINIDNVQTYPAGYNHYAANVIAVAATDYNDVLATFSCYGPRWCDIAAPGVSVYSTYPNGQYMSMSGTSMATPHVSGAAALVKSRYPNATAAVLKARLLYSADHPATMDGYTRWGRLDVFNALQNDTTPPAAPTGLMVSHTTGTGLKLAWVAPAGDGPTLAVSAYNVYYGTSPDLVGAQVVDSGLKPATPGAMETFDLMGLLPQTTYYVGLQAVDKVGNPSPRVMAPPATTGSIDLFDGAESTPLFERLDPADSWGVTNTEAHSGSHSYGQAVAGSLGILTNALVSKAAIALTNPAYVRVWAKLDLEDYSDYLYLMVLVDGVPYYYYGGTGKTGWAQYQLNLAQYRGRSVKIGFAVYRNGSSPAVSHRAFLDDIQLVQLSQVIEDKVEGEPQFTGFPPWSITTEASSSPTHSWSDSPGGKYGANAQLPLMQNASVSTTAVGAPWIVYRAKVDLEPQRDYLYVYFSGDGGGSWLPAGSNSGVGLGWVTSMLALPTGLKQSRLLFFLDTNEAVEFDGIHLDDIGIWGEPFTPVAGSPGDVDGDGAVTSEDLAIVQAVAAGRLAEGQLPCLLPRRADFNSNGRLDAGDAAVLQAILSGNQ